MYTYCLLQILAVVEDGPSNPGIGAHDSWFQVLRSSKNPKGFVSFGDLCWLNLVEGCTLLEINITPAKKAFLKGTT